MENWTPEQLGYLSKVTQLLNTHIGPGIESNTIISPVALKNQISATTINTICLSWIRIDL